MRTTIEEFVDAWTDSRWQVVREEQSERKEKMTNAEWIQRNKWKFSEISVQRDGCMLNIYIRGNLIEQLYDTVGSSEYALRMWLDEEHKEPVLDEAEKKYLSEVIKPFRKKVDKISKFPNDEFEYIRIYMHKDGVMNFPDFKKGTMYKGMELGKTYTLEELGI